MWLTIDTTKDSKEEISKAIKLLNSLLGHDFHQNSNQNLQNEQQKISPNRDIFASNEPSLSNIMSIFDGADQAETEQKKEPEFTNLLDVFDVSKNESKKENSKISKNDAQIVEFY